jgi:hypothetical protein
MNPFATTFRPLCAHTRHHLAFTTRELISTGSCRSQVRTSTSSQGWVGGRTTLSFQLHAGTVLDLSGSCYFTEYDDYVCLLHTCAWFSFSFLLL